ncbi:MAG: organic solvent tolerance protein OstA [Treponema sp.]|nr:organic solvent tolerance protein OstA [Treponema sp.]
MKLSPILPAIILFSALAVGLLSGPAYGEMVMFRADSMTGKSGNTGEFARLSGNASITTSSVEIFADVIELSGKDYRYIKAIGNVSGSNIKEKIDFTCAEMLYDRELKLSSMQDTVHLVDRANETIANAQMMEYDEKSGSVVMQISVAMQQKDNVCTGSYAIYNTQTRKLFLSGNPQVIQGTDTFRAQEIVLDLDTNEVTLDGRVRGAVKRKDE